MTVIIFCSCDHLLALSRPCIRALRVGADLDVVELRKANVYIRGIVIVFSDQVEIPFLITFSQPANSHSQGKRIVTILVV